MNLLKFAVASRCDAGTHAIAAEFVRASVKDWAVPTTTGASDHSMLWRPMLPFQLEEIHLELNLTFVALLDPMWGGEDFAGMSTYDWQPKAMPQMGRQRNTPSMCTILTCPSHQPLSSPWLNEDTTIWEEGGEGRDRGYGWNQNEEGKDHSN